MFFCLIRNKCRRSFKPSAIILLTLQVILSPMEIIINKANNLYLELPHKIYYTIKSARTKKQFEFFEVILALPLCLMLSLNFVDLHSAISKEQVVPSVKHRVWCKQKSARQTSLYLISIANFIRFCYMSINLFFFEARSYSSTSNCKQQ